MPALNETEALTIDEAIRLLIKDLAPGARYQSKYGGKVIMPDANSNEFVGGIFTYAEHVALEFSEGASFEDPSRHLEGKGKKRRHLKFRTRSDIDAKDAKSFLRQAFQTS